MDLLDSIEIAKYKIFSFIEALFQRHFKLKARNFMNVIFFR